MAKLTRATQKLFGSTAGVNEISTFGSLKAGVPAFTNNPATIQSLSNYLAGWFQAVIGGNSPAIEDMNALFYLYAYQLVYIFQAGVPEWDSGTTYYIGSFASDGLGNIYTSLTDTNLNNALSNTTNWRSLSGSNIVSINPATQSPYVLTSVDNGKLFLVNCANGAMQFTLPAAINNFSFTYKDDAGVASDFPITLSRAASESLEGLASNYVATADYGEWSWKCDGTNWWFA